MRKVVSETEINVVTTAELNEQNKIYAGTDTDDNVVIVRQREDNPNFVTLIMITPLDLSTANGYNGDGEETCKSILNGFMQFDEWGDFFEFDSAHEFFTWAARVTA